jgi:hypothetical protein
MPRPVAPRSRADPPLLPDWIRPQLTELVDAAPDGPDWLHEIKYDGYRMHARLDRGAVRLLTRTGLDWTHKYPAIAAEHQRCLSAAKRTAQGPFAEPRDRRHGDPAGIVAHTRQHTFDLQIGGR